MLLDFQLAPVKECVDRETTSTIVSGKNDAYWKCFRTDQMILES